MDITLTGPDQNPGDKLSYKIASLPLSGDLTEGSTSITSAHYVLSEDTVTYTARSGFMGEDSFTFKINDGFADSNVATVTVNVWPTGLVVTKTRDSSDGVCDGDCSLREAIGAASSGDTITVPTGTYTLTSEQQLTIDESVTLKGAGSGDTIIQAATSAGVASWRVFVISSGTNVSISGVTMPERA